MIKGTSVLSFIVCVAIPLLIGIISGMATSKTDGWYDSLIRPSFNPPGYLFGIVWPTLYILMGISLYLVWKSEPGSLRNIALWVFAIQMVLNFLWSFIFFRFHLIGWAFVEILLVWVSIVVMIIVFMRINRAAGFLQIPYLLWVTFASVLNGAYWIQNR
ncbi:MAG: tryptophan-rich sensory protein [Bacteroidales bacterium]|nr:tryptophan-rich sensory protein [Bacteroidales bacterium]